MNKKVSLCSNHPLVTTFFIQSSTLDPRHSTLPPCPTPSFALKIFDSRLALGVSPYGLPAVVSRASSQPCLGPKLYRLGEVNDRTKSVSSVERPESSTKKRSLTTEDTESTEGGAGGNQRADSAEFLEGHSQAGLQMDSEKLASIRSANDSRASREQTGSDSESVIIRDIRGKKSSAPATSYSPQRRRHLCHPWPHDSLEMN